MTQFVYTPGHGQAAWHRYLAKEHAARSAYLATVQHAHREYLTGPWPDRDAYEAVERSAWRTYYAAGREAWQFYNQEMTPPPPPPDHHSHVEIPVYPADHRTDPEARMPRRFDPNTTYEGTD